jgi:serine/threonine protein kinase
MGGDLFEHVVNCGKLSEIETQAILRSLLVSSVAARLTVIVSLPSLWSQDGIIFLHSKSIVHRGQ